MEHALERLAAAHLTAVGPGLRHTVENLEQMPIRALVLVDRHPTRKASSGFGSDTLTRAVEAVASP